MTKSITKYSLYSYFLILSITLISPPLSKTENLGENIDKAPIQNEIKYTSESDSFINTIDKLYEPIEESYIDNIVTNLTSILKNFIFYEIMQNPPEPEGKTGYVHPAIDLKDALGKIDKKDRKFYDFYRDLRQILSTPRDHHFRIYGLRTPKNINIAYMTACLPFSFYVDKDENNKTKIYIKYFEDCARFYSEEKKTFIKDKVDRKFAVEKINDTNPFDYIQNFGMKYLASKCPHAHFVYMKKIIHDFYLHLLPYNKEELTNITFKFENESEPLVLNYYIYNPEDAEDPKFDETFESIQKPRRQFIDEISIFEVVRQYKQQKGLLTKEEKKVQSTTIDWDFKSAEPDGIRCKVDDDKEINILVQENFKLDMTKGHEIIYNCTKKFHQNNYKVIVIQSLNGGGWGELSLSLRQLLQVQIKNRNYMAYNPVPFVEEAYIKTPNNYLNIDTCDSFKDANDFLNGKDVNFSTSDKTIIHKNTKMTDMIKKEVRLELEKQRKELLNLNIKKPTDIIIFLDSYAYSATSIFAKAIQNEGAAITVGFNGNPYKSEDIFDSSQSPGPVADFSTEAEYNNLKSLGIMIRGITFGETYEDDYAKENPIPREYKLDAVDERVDIYESYSDDKLDLFISTAKDIFKKYNEEKKCNPKNKKLVFYEKDKCVNFEDDKFAHGGYVCGSNGIWSTTCQKYYCDLGYYYNVYKGRCLRDYCTNPPKEINIILNDTYDENITINFENNDKYIFTIDTNKYIYSFESNEPSYIVFDKDQPCPAICIFQKDAENHKNKIYINYEKNFPEKDITIRIKSYPKVEISTMTFSDINLDKTEITSEKNIIIAEVKENYILYFKTFEQRANIFYTKYDSNIKIDDIININEKYFKSCTNEIVHAEKGNTYIIATMSEINENLMYIFIQPESLNKQIDISESKLQNNFYLSDTSEEYTLNFEKNNYDRIIHLSNAIKDSEVIIKNGDKETTLNSANPYYSFDNVNGIFTGKLTLKNKKETGSVIEFLYANNENNYEILEEKEYNDKRLSKPIIMKFYNNMENSNITIKLSSKKGKEFNYKYITGYSKNNYINIPIVKLPELTCNGTNELNILNKKGNTNDETLYLILDINPDILSDNNYEIIISKNETNNSTPEEKVEPNKGLPTWALVLIIIGSVIVLLIIFLVIYKCTCNKKGDDDLPGSLLAKNDVEMT